MKHPMGVYVVSITELWGRCSLLFFASLLVLFMMEVLHLSNGFSTILYGVIMGFCFIMQLLTGYLTDTYLGNRKSIIIGSILMFIALLVLAYGGSLYYLTANTPVHSSFIFTLPEIIFIIGATLFAIGIGFYKVSVTSFVALFYKDNEELLDSAYTIFYMLGNLGAFFAPVILNFVVGVNNPSLYQYGFLLSAIAIFIGLLNFLILKDKYLHLENGEPLGVYPISKVIEKKTETGNIKKLTPIEIDRMKVILLIFVVSIVIYMSLEQITTSMVLLAMHYMNNVIPFTHFTLNPEFFICLNPLFVAIFSIGFIKITDYLAGKDKDPSSISKLSIGLLMAVLAFIFLLIPTILASGKMSMMWLVLFNIFLVFAELLTGPICFSLVSKLAPVKHASLMIGASLAVTSVSEVLAGYFASVFPQPGCEGELLFSFIPINDLSSFLMIFIIIIGALFIAWTLSRGKIKELMHGVE